MTSRNCDICGGPLGMFKKHKAADGYFCQRCFVAAGFSAGTDCANDTIDQLKVTMNWKQSTEPPAVLTHYAPPSPSFRSGLSDGHLPTGRKEAEMMAVQWLKHATDSVKIINTTKKPSTFFERYDFFIDTLERLAYCEKWVSFRGELPSSKLRNTETEQKEQIRLFILRYAQDTREKMYQLSTQKGKLSKAEAYYNTLNEYSDRIDNDNILLLTEQYELLKQIAQ